MSGDTAMAMIVGGVAVLLLVASIMRGMTRRTRLPFTVLLVLVGILLQGLADVSAVTEEIAGHLVISPGLILFVFLPTLVFESAYNMDVRLLRHDLPQVISLAVPGLLLSTFLIGGIVMITTSIPPTYALLLGAILSATDPVSVVALFRQLGAPRRLTILVEGESLFNDATAIVVSQILVGVVLAGTISVETVLMGVPMFLAVCLGGVLCGWLMGLAASYALGWVRADAYIEVTITTVVAYLSFLIAEEALHVSGVMATMTAGLTIGSWGRMRISPPVRQYMERFWEYMVFVSNALIFLMVGLRVDLPHLQATWRILIWVIAAMLISRGVVVYGLVPLVSRFPGAEAVNRRFQTVMYWGGLRGAVSLALVLSLPAFDEHPQIRTTLVAVVMGSVLWTLLVQGLSIDMLVQRLGLTRPPVADRFLRIDTSLAAKQRALSRIPEMEKGGLFSSVIAKRLTSEVRDEIDRTRNELDQLREQELDPQQEEKLLCLWGFTEEKALAADLFAKGLVSEPAYRELTLNLNLQIDGLRHAGEFRHVDVHRLARRKAAKWLLVVLDKICGPLARNIHTHRIAIDYEITWARCRGCQRVLSELDAMIERESVPDDAAAHVRGQYKHWFEQARERTDRVAEEYPEFVQAMQERLGRRMMRIAESEGVEELSENGALPEGLAEDMQEEIADELEKLEERKIETLSVEPQELLRKVPFFQKMSEGDFEWLAHRMIERNFAEHETVIRQGEAGESLFLIARGVLRVTREDNGRQRDLATLMAGDFFGEMALLDDEPRTASVAAVTPCSLYELTRHHLETAMKEHPHIRHALETEAAVRRSTLESSIDEIDEE